MYSNDTKFWQELAKYAVRTCVQPIVLITQCLHIINNNVPTYVSLLCSATVYDSSVNQYFIVAARSAIYQVSLDGTRSHILIANTTNSVAIDYDYR